MFKKRLHLALFSQYFLPYALVLIIPMIVSGVIVYFNFLNLTKERELQANQEELQQIRNVIDTQFVEMIRIVFQLSELPGLTSEQTDNPEKILNVRSVLNYSIANDAINEVAVYFHGAPYIFSANSTYLPHIFHRIHFEQQWSYSEMMEKLNHLTGDVVFPAASGRSPDRMIKYLVPIPYNSKHPYATAVFFIKEKSLLELFDSMMKYRDGNAYAFDHTGQLILSTNGGRPRDAEAIQRLLQAGEQDMRSIELDGTTYLLSYVKSNTTGWTYATLVSRNEVMAPVNHIIRRTLMATALIVLLGAAVIFLGMRFNYLPIRKLIDLSEKKWGQVLKDSRGIHKLTAAIEHADVLDAALRSQTEKVGPVLREHLLSQLLKGRIASKEELEREGGPVGLKLMRSKYCVHLLLFGGARAQGGWNKAELALRYAGLLHESIEYYHVEMLDAHMTAFILSCDDAVGGEPAADYWERLHKTFVAATGVPVTIGIGQPCDLDQDCSKLSASYIEAATAIQYRMIKGSNQVIHFHETAAETPRLDWYPAEELEELALRMRQRQADAALEAVNGLSQALREHCSSLYMAQSIGIEVVNRVMRTMNEISNGTLTGREYPDVLNIVRYDNKEELIDKVIEVCAQACEDVRRLQRNGDETPYRIILNYIEEHALEYDFSIQSMGEAIGISKAHIHRIFKEHCGRTVMDVVNELRLREAKRILTETDTPLAEIVNRIGYADVSSFIRKFKQAVHMTPGEFRKLYGKET